MTISWFMFPLFPSPFGEGGGGKRICWETHCSMKEDLHPTNLWGSWGKKSLSWGFCCLLERGCWDLWGHPVDVTSVLDRLLALLQPLKHPQGSCFHSRNESGCEFCVVAGFEPVHCTLDEVLTFRLEPSAPPCHDHQLVHVSTFSITI